MFNKFDFMFNEFVSSLAKTIVAVEISKKIFLRTKSSQNKKTINLSRKNQFITKKKKHFFSKKRFCSKISKMSKKNSKT
jgi:hypothetical protein